MWKHQPPFPNWSQQSFPSSSPWLNQAIQPNWPNFPYTPPYWQNNVYPPQWTPPTSQNQTWQTNWQGLMNQPVGTIPLPQPTLPSLQQNPQSNLRLQLPAQPNPNPNNIPV